MFFKFNKEIINSNDVYLRIVKAIKYLNIYSMPLMYEDHWDAPGADDLLPLNSIQHIFLHVFV